MAEMVTIDGRQYMKRNPLGVLGLTIVTLGIYFLVWYYKINDELRRSEKDETINPTRSLMAMLFGWIIIVPPVIAMYNTAKHVQNRETRLGIQQTLEPALTIVLLILLAVANGMYVQEHLNRGWDAAATAVQTGPSPAPASPTLV